MSVYGIGIDVVEVARTRRLLKSRNCKHFLCSNFTDDEIRYANGCPYKISGMFAAKEAFYKAIGSGWVNGKDVEIVHEKEGMPTIKVSKRIEKKIGKRKIKCSISYSDLFAFAVVVISS